MNPDIKQAWLAALRSGEYKQARHALRRDGAFCCLGVICDLHHRAGLGQWEDRLIDDQYDGDASGLPPSVLAWAGLDQRFPIVDGVCITELNDGADGDEEDIPPIHPHSFLEIADLIEAHL